MREPEFFSFVSTRAGSDPVKTIFLCPPDSAAGTKESAEAFACSSGWLDQAEADGALLIVPIAEHGWASESEDLLCDIYNKHRNNFIAPSHSTILGRKGSVWTWEPLIHVVGYEEGACFAGNALVAHPCFSATTTLIDGVPSSFRAAERSCDCWFVPSPKMPIPKNRDVSVAVLLGGSAAEDEETLSYCKSVSEAPYFLVRPELGGDSSDIAFRVLHDFMNHVVRWKNSPTGTLQWRASREEFYRDSRFIHGAAELRSLSYCYALHLPQGRGPEDVAGLPLVISLHGRGEPAWLFADKNGWEDLADETGEFALVQIDSPGNIWSQFRDEGIIGLIREELIDRYGFDGTRIYLTGFSNGAAFTWQQASTHPDIFAAASPWNCPPEAAIAGSGMGDYLLAPSFAASGYQIPLWICAGDADAKAPLEARLVQEAVQADGCLPAGETVPQCHYGAGRGYAEGNRFETTAYLDAEGHCLVESTVMKDMPHGAIHDEARAAWRFMKQFRRPQGSKIVEVKELV